jgi:hypothetical protein
VTISVGNGVGVSVGGNQTMVGVRVTAGVEVSVECMGIGVAVEVTVHAHKKILTTLSNNKFFILSIKIDALVVKTVYLSKKRNTMNNRKGVVKLVCSF